MYVDVANIFSCIQLVVGLTNTRATERVGLNDICACLQVVEMDFPNNLRLGDDQNIVVTLELIVM